MESRVLTPNSLCELDKFYTERIMRALGVYASDQREGTAMKHLRVLLLGLVALAALG